MTYVGVCNYLGGGRNRNVDVVGTSHTRSVAFDSANMKQHYKINTKLFTDFLVDHFRQVSVQEGEGVTSTIGHCLLHQSPRKLRTSLPRTPFSAAWHSCRFPRPPGCAPCGTRTPAGICARWPFARLPHSMLNTNTSSLPFVKTTQR